MILGGYDYLRLKGILERLRESPRADHRQFAVLGATHGRLRVEEVLYQPEAAGFYFV